MTQTTMARDLDRVCADLTDSLPHPVALVTWHTDARRGPEVVVDVWYAQSDADADPTECTETDWAAISAALAPLGLVSDGDSGPSGGPVIRHGVTYAGSEWATYRVAVQS